MNLVCQCGSCEIHMSEYKDEKKTFRRNRLKAGAIIYDPRLNRLVLIQSRGNLWGFPKGSLEDNENNNEGAIREVKEETGILLQESQLLNSHKVKNAVYFEVYITYTPLNIQKSPGNDANSVAWLRPTCIQDLVNKNKIKLNSHCRSLCEKLFSLKFQK